jgi:hypothetical protein
MEVSQLNIDIPALKAQHGELWLLEAEGEDLICVVKKPGRAHLSRYISDVTSGNAHRAMTNLFFDCLLAPEPEGLRKRLEEDAGLIVPLGTQLVGMAKLNVEVTAKKL